MKKSRARVALIGAVLIAVGGSVTVLTATPASAHGAMMKPGARSYLCWQDGLTSTGEIKPQNPACSAAVAQMGLTSLYNWFAVLRSDAAGRNVGFIPNDQVCSGGTGGPYDFTGLNLARTDWPTTHLTSGASFDWWYSNWAAHPGTWKMYITKDGWDPSQPVSWDDFDLNSPFLQVTNPAMTGAVLTNDGHYYWTGNLPSGKSGRHVIYSQWIRSDSNENFFGCSDVVFDGGHGEVTGLSGGTTATTTATTSTTTTRPSTTTTSQGTTTTSQGTTTTSQGTTTTSRGTTTTSQGGGGTCSASFSAPYPWAQGFVATVTVTANSPLSSWRVIANLPSGTVVTNSWNSVRTGTTGAVTFANESYNGTVGTGQSTSFGFQGSGSPNGVTVSCSGS